MIWMSRLFMSMLFVRLPNNKIIEKKMHPMFANAVEEEEDRERRYELQLERRILRDRVDLMNLPAREFIKLFRLSKEIYQTLVNELTPHIQEGQRSTKLSAETRILAALRFFATGSYQRGIGEEGNVGICQQSVSNTLAEICTAFEEIAPRWIKFPDTEDKKQEVKLQFMDRFNFPGVIGVVDGTHVAILQPVEDEHLYLNRKRFHSKNVQIVCDANLRILSVNANYGGASHDSFVWRNSAISRYMEENYRQGDQCWLLGDSGYPQQPWLLTPIRNTIEGTPERRYDEALTLARNSVERCIGVLKMRFRCLLKERVLRYNPHKAGMIINACCVLHNMCIMGNVPLDEEDLVEDNQDEPVNINLFPIDIIAEGIRQRQNIVNLYFN